MANNTLETIKKWTAAHEATWRMGQIVMNGEFSRFACPETDNAWLGFEAAWEIRDAEIARLQAENERLRGQLDGKAERAASPAPAAAHAVMPSMPETDDRQPYDDEEPDGYLESDRDWAVRNNSAVEWLADNHTAIRAALAEIVKKMVDAFSAGYDVANADYESGIHAPSYDDRLDEYLARHTASDDRRPQMPKKTVEDRA